MSTSTATRPRRYGFLASPGWIALIAVALLLAATMVGLGFWQLSRYHERTEINERIAAAGKAPPRPLGEVLAVSKPAREDVAWARVTATGEYDTEHEILVRGRTVNGRVGFEVVTPLVLDDGTAVLVDRGWVPPGESGATALPDVPEAPGGEVTVVGRVHLPESGGDRAVNRNGALQSRRIDPAKLAPAVDHQLYGGYLLLQKQTPPAGSGFVSVPVQYEDPGQNLSYMVQWWLFSLIALVGTGYLIRREARQRETPATDAAG